MDTSVVICTYNRASSLRRTLESIRHMSVPADLEWELVVVDNNSTDDTRAVVDEFGRSSNFVVRYVFEPRQGVSHARNAGVANAAGEIIAFTDDDVLVSPAWLRELACTFAQFDCTGVTGKSVPLWDGLARPKWLANPGPYYLGKGPLLDFNLGEETKSINVPPFTLNVAFKKTAFERHGLFRIDLGVSGLGGLLGEDVEFGARLIRAGEQIVYSPKAVVYHPVHKERLTREYFLSFACRAGRAQARMEQAGLEAALWLGVPRRFFREALGSGRMWLGSFNNSKRFYFKAHTYLSLARIAEAWKLRKERRSITMAGSGSRPPAGPDGSVARIPK